MLRLTSHDYLINRRLLCVEWKKRNGAAFAELPLQYQRDLHDYFAPSVTFTDKEALTHRDEMTKAFPSLPQKAGRALQAIHAAVDDTPNQIVDTHRAKTTTVASIAGKRRSLRIAGAARPKLDHLRLARALLAIERHDVDGKLLAKVKKLRDRRSH